VLTVSGYETDGVTSFDDLVIEQIGADTVIHFNHFNSVTLTGVDSSLITEADIVF
jgi:hypothetical protein